VIILRKIDTTTTSGISNHSELNELDYADSGHTGFQPAGAYTTVSDLTTLSGQLQDDIDNKPDTLLELTDTPSVYDEGKFLKSTTSGTEWATISGSGGTSFHSELYELDYASSGHTGFQPAGDYLTEEEFSTYSGTLQTQIDDKSDIGHLHDDRYYRVNFEKFILNTTDISNKYIDLLMAPKSNDSLNLFVDGGGKGLLDTDYTVSGTRIDWGSREYDGILEIGDIISTVCWY